MLGKRLIIAIVFTLTMFTASVAHAVPHYSTIYSKGIIKQVATGKLKGYYKKDYHHYNPYQTDCLVRLAYRESTWRNWATNGSCWGLFQLSNSMKRWQWYNPNWNTDRAIHYIIGRYGTPSKALQHSYDYGWY